MRKWSVTEYWFVCTAPACTEARGGEKGTPKAEPETLIRRELWFVCTAAACASGEGEGGWRRGGGEEERRRRKGERWRWKRERREERGER